MIIEGKIGQIQMTNRTAETSPLVYARVAGLRTPKVIKQIADM